LDIAGYSPNPIINVVADGANAGISLLRGNVAEAGVNALGLLPGLPMD
jgi:hypothetical protein